MEQMKTSRFARFDSLVGSAAKSVQRLKSLYMEKYQLSAAHTDCLCRLLEKENGLTQMELARLEEMDRAQVSRVLRALGEKGFVFSGEGGYKRRYYLTEAGKSIATEIQSTILSVNRFVSDDISAGEIETFYRVFARITENLRRAALISGEKKESMPFREDQI